MCTSKIFCVATSCVAIVSSFFLSPAAILAAETTAEAGGGHPDFGILFVALAVLLLSAKIGGIVEKFGQPSVLGELAAGVVLSAFAYFGWGLIEEIRHNEIMAFFAEFGAVLLLFQVGLESNVQKLLKVGTRSVFVALIGATLPFVLGSFVLGPILFPEMSNTAHLFIGAAMVATSVGITASVFRGLGMSQTRAAQTFLGATLIDDVLGLLTLAVVSAIAVGGEVTPGFIGILVVRAVAFLLLAVFLGNLLAPYFSRLFARISTGTGMKMVVSIFIALIYAYLATLVGLAPIVGAFAAGLILDAVHFKNYTQPEVVTDLLKLKGFDKEEKQQIDKLVEHHSHMHVEDLIGTVSMVFVPLFFIYTGLQIDFASLLRPELYLYAGAIALVAILAKLLAGAAANGDLREKALVGMAMVPRGEVGLIFASVGRALGAINDDLFSIIVLVIIATTFIAPPVIKTLALAKR